MFLSKRLLLFLISCLTYYSVSSQTLYWVGSHGNFNDPSHWSLTPGGLPANLTPNANSDIVFMSNVINQDLKVIFNTQATVNSVVIRTPDKLKFVHAAGMTKLIIKRKFDNEFYSKNFSSEINIEFKNSSGNAEGYINTGTALINSDIIISSGKWKVGMLAIEKLKTLYIFNSSVDFHFSGIDVGNLDMNNCGLLNFDRSIIKVRDEIKVKNCSQATFNKAAINLKYYNNDKSVTENFHNIMASKGSSNQINSACFNFTTRGVSCSPGCDGSVTFTLPALTCYTPTAFTSYNVFITNSGCPGNPSSLLGVAPGVYTITSFCACTYGLYVEDQLGNPLETVSLPFPPPVILTSPGSGGTTLLNCGGVCNGSLNVNFFNTTGPYSFTVTPPGAPSFVTTSNGTLSLSGLCSGTLIVLARDQNNCPNTFSRNFNAPQMLVPNFVKNDISCNGACSGSFSISPTGGTPNYTVSYNSGPPVFLAPSGSSIKTALCPGPISATLTDSKSCSVTVSGNIFEPPSMNITTITPVNIACSGVCNGSAVVTVTGGISPYSFTLTPAAGAATIINSFSGIISPANLCGGNYSLAVRDANLCLRTQTFTIAQPPPLSLPTTFTNVSCNGGNNGKIVISPSGGNGGPYSYTWAPTPITGQNTATVSNLTANIYTFTVGYGGSCSQTLTIAISEPLPINLSLLSQTISCFGICNGASTVIATGGNGGYTYNWSPVPPAGAGTGTISSLCGGSSYTVSVSDASLCVYPVLTVSVTQASSITPNVTTSNISCGSVCNGSINATPTGPAIFNYTLASLSSTITTAPPYTGLCAGSYTIYVRNMSTSCTQSSVTAITAPSPLVGSFTVTPVNCFNACDGALAASVSGGTPTYTTSIATPSSGIIPGSSLNNLCPGTYTLLITDFNGCTNNTVTATLTQPPNLTVTVNSNSITCASLCNGILTASISGGTPGYTILWSPAGGNSNIASGLCANNYTLTVTDAKNCVRTTSASVTAPTSITVTKSVTDVSCAGGSNGSATIIATGGNPNYTFQFNSSPVVTNTTGIINGLPQGNYIVTVTDINSCIKSATFAISSPPILSAAITGTQNSCNVCIGAATVQASGGTAPFTYAWTSSVSAVGNSSVAVNLCPGTYTVLITDSKLCTVTQTAHISQVVTINLTLGGTPIQCFGQCTGSAVVVPSNGVPPYQYLWSSGSSVNIATGLCIGNFSVIVTDNNSCSTTGTINITQPTSLTATSSQTNVTCNGLCNGSINNIVSGGTGSIQYSFATSSSVVNTPSLTNLCAGNYTLTARDQNLCLLTLPIFTITQNPPIVIASVVTSPTACTANNGNICASVSGGSGGPYTFNWTPAAGSASCISGLASGSYSLVVTDVASCTNSVSILVTNPTGPTLTAVSQSINCFGSSTGAATVSASGVNPFSFTWTPSVSFSTTVGNSTSASGLSTGTYVVLAKDQNSCTTSQIIVINQASSVTANATVTNVRCNAANNGSIIIAPTGGTAPYNSFNWLPGGLTGAGTRTVTGLSAQNYSVTINDFFNCASTFTFQITQPNPLLLTNTLTNVKCNAACDGSIVAFGSGGTGAITYSWLPVGGFTGSTTASAANLCPNTYTVKITDLNGCVATNIIAITQPPAITTTLVLKNATCSNSCNAIASHLVAGGTPGYLFSWSSSAATSSVISGLCAGNYTGTIVDSKGCIASKGFTVTPPPPFLLSLTATNPKCNAVCNGSITTSVSGANGTVSFSWNAGLSGQNPTNICPGNYSVVAIDDSLCVASGVTSLVDPPALLANLTTTNPACAGTCNGIVLSSPVNSVGVVSYSYTPILSNSAFHSNVCAGSYTLNIADGNGCLASQTFTLLDPPPLLVIPSTNAATCGSPNGSITANVSGGSPAYTYNWLSPVSTNSTISGVPAGIYTLVVSDSRNCTNTVTIPLSNSNGPTFVPISTTSISCNGQCTGAASVNIGGIVGGTPGYTVSWLPPISTTINAISNLCAGGYTAQITDANNCVLFSGINILQPPAVTLTPTFGLPGCNGICDGSISLNPTGGVGPSYTFTWFPTGSNGPVITNACSGTYNVLVGDNGNSCVYSRTVILPAQLNIIASTSVNPNQCSVDCNATATAFNISGGVAPYVFNWSNGQSGPVATNLCNGIYTLKVTDANGCFSNFTVNVSSGAPITTSVSITSPSCNLCNGVANIVASGGGGSFTYNWTNGSTGTTVSGLCAGIYQVLITDASLGCKRTETVIINNSNGISGENFTIKNISCLGTCDGGATVTATGGTAPISYHWITPATSNSVITNLCAGTYFVQMADAQGCLRTSSVVIYPTNPLNIAAFITPPSCGLSNGTIGVVISGGIQGYNVVWNPAAGASPTITGIGQGSYTVTVTESGPNNCSLSQQINVSNTTGPIINASQGNINCFNACTGSVSASATGTGPLTYRWSNGAIVPTVINLCKGVITVTVTDQGTNCVSIRSFTITDNPPIQAGVPHIAQPTCNLCNGVAISNVFGGILPYTYTWTTGATTSSLSGLCAGLYQLSIKDAFGCQNLTNIAINNSTGITGETFSVQGLPCAGTCNGSATVTALGGTQPISYNWITPAVSNSVITNLCSGNYFVQMTDAQGCLRTASVGINAATVLSITPTVIPPGCGMPNGSIFVAISGGQPAYSVTWTPTGTNTPTLSGVSQGSYTITVTESGPNKCSLSQQINLSNVTGPTVTATQTNINCFNACTGVITATAVGSGLLTYSWSVGGTSPTVNNLCKGVVTLTVTDGNNCATIRSFTITENPPLQTGVPQITQPTCNQCNGVAAINVSGGTLPFTYLWTTGSTLTTVSNLCAGLYQVDITDALGCQQIANIIINNSNGISGQTFSVQGLPCSGVCDGSITVAAIGGNAPINYQWINPAVSNSVITNLCSGTYFVQMVDAQGCIRTASTSIAPAISLSLSPTILSPGCTMTNGSILLNISGGTPAYSISWQPIANNTATLAGIGQGSYTVTVTESGPDNCALTQVINVSNITGPIVSSTQTNISCFGACSGVISVSTTGSGPFAYNWSIGGNSPIATNLCSGVITLTVTDINNCVTIKTFTVKENAPILSALPQIVQPSCNLCNGVATVNAFGGSMPFTYLWTTGGSGQTGTNLCAGIYQVLITDKLGCQLTKNVVINNSTGIAGETFNVKNELCAGSCNGSATVTALGGTAPISYSWINPPSSNTAVNNLCAGNYFVQMTDAAGCIRTASVMIDAATSLTLNSQITQPACTASNGSVNVSVSGGTPPYIYSWLPSGNTSSLTNLAPGSYTLTVTDKNGAGCAKTQVINMSSFNAPSVTFTQTNINCFNTCTGSVTAIASGSASPFTYTWSNGSNISTAGNLCKGLTTLTISAANGCVSIRSFSITDAPELKLSAPNLVKPGCFNNCDGAITIIPSGGSLPYTYSWSPTGIGNPITSVCAGTYTSVITDAKGCANTSTVQLKNPAAITVTSNPFNSSCSSIADGSISIIITGGTPAYSYTWTGPSAFVSNQQNLSNILSGTYSLTLSDDAGCKRDTMLILVPTITISAQAGRDTVICSVGTVTINGTNSTGVAKYSWFMLPDNTNPVSTSATYVPPIVAGTSTYVLLTVASVPACRDQDTVLVSTFPEIYVDAGQNQLIPVFSSVTIGGNPTILGAMSLTWSPSFALSDQFAQNPIASNTVNITYTVTATDNNGCMASDTVMVNLYPEVKISNGFSPNGDGKNDSWIIDYIDQFPENTVEIYNRWGEQLFYSQGYPVPFNGTYHGKDLPVGTYYYVINLNHPAYTKPYTGPLTIFR